MIIAAVMGIVLGAAGGGGWWDGDWSCRQRIYLDTSILSGDLERFPLTVRLAGAGVEAARPDGADLRAVDAAGTELPLEVSDWSAAGGALTIQIPFIAGRGESQYVDVYYGNPGATAPGASRVWDDSCRAIYHFSRNPNNAVGGAPAEISGAVNVGETVAVFSGEPGFLAVPEEVLKGMGDAITITTRINMAPCDGVQNIASGKRAAEPEEWFNFGAKCPDIVHTNATSDGKRAGELNVEGIAPDEWHGVAVRYDARDHTRTICIDGIVLQQDTALTGPLRMDEMRIGRGVLHFEPWQFHGAMDEVRIAAAARPDAWLRAETATLGDRGVFAIVGPVQRQGEPLPPPAPFALLRPADGTTCRARAGIPLQWQPVGGATEYKVLLYDASDAAEPFATIPTGTATKYQLTQDQAGRAEVWWSVSAHTEGGDAAAQERRALSFYVFTVQALSPVEFTQKPCFNVPERTSFALEGYLKERIERVIQRYFLETPESSPAILQVLRDRDRRPVRDPLVPWAGEFAGKYLTGAELTWRLTRDSSLKDTIDTFVRDLLACQQEDGYLGPFPKESRLTGGNWDVWGHYHCLIGLMFYYEDTNYGPALDACMRAADLLFETFGPGGPTLTCDGSGGEMNMAICHALLLLHVKTGIARYRELAEYVINDAWNEPSAGHYLDSALAGKPLIEFPRHRWESLHDWMALAQMYWLTGDAQYRTAFEHIYHSGLDGDRHDTGGVTSGEGFQGTPYHTGAIETCCTVAWIAYSIEMLRMTGDSRVADEIEWSTFNSALGAIPYSGRACAYNVPMDGSRCYGVELPWQAPKAGPDLNCCAVNANRPLGMIAQWALLECEDGVALNYYGPGRLIGGNLTISQQTDYPRSGDVHLVCESRVQPLPAKLYLRIPFWSKTTHLSINGTPTVQGTVTPGTYYPVALNNQTRTTIDISFDFSLQSWAGEDDFAGKAAVYRGPLLLAYDARFNTLDPADLPALDWDTVIFEPRPWEGALPPWLLGDLRDAQGRAYTVCDFSSAGQTGNQYLSWLPMRGVPAGRR